MGERQIAHVPQLCAGYMWCRQADSANDSQACQDRPMYLLLLPPPPLRRLLLGAAAAGVFKAWLCVGSSACP